MPLAALDLLFTLSRGSVIALGMGVVAWLVVDPNRLRTSAWLWIWVPWTVVAVWHTHSVRALFGSRFGLASAPSGHRLAWQVLVLAALGAGAVYAAALVEARWRPSAFVRRSYAASQVGVLVAAAAVALADMAPHPRWRTRSDRRSTPRTPTQWIPHDSSRSRSPTAPAFGRLRGRMGRRTCCEARGSEALSGARSDIATSPPTPMPHTAPIWRRSPSWGWRTARCSR